MSMGGGDYLPSARRRVYYVKWGALAPVPATFAPGSRQKRPRAPHNWQASTIVRSQSAHRGRKFRHVFARWGQDGGKRPPRPCARAVLQTSAGRGYRLSARPPDAKLGRLADSAPARNVQTKQPLDAPMLSQFPTARFIARLGHSSRLDYAHLKSCE
ncbi:unnamed protein product, partial [Iphiclides podalirius]